jgi:transposase
LRNNNYSPEFKREIILKVLNGDISSYRASIEYCISKGTLEKWVKKAREYGLNAHTINGQSNSISQSMYQSKKNSSRLLTREEELLQENEYLRAENAFLKKLKALVDERVAREKRSTRRSSKN